MKIYVHIGTHKTGTTSIQLTLASNEKALRKQGYLYPQSGRPDRSEWRYGNHELAFSLVGMHDTPLTVWNDFHREIQQSGFDHVIVSAEDFSLANRQQIRELSALLSDYRVSIILYLRDPIDFMKSHYAQRVRSSGYDLKFRDYVEENLWRVNYPAVVT